MLFHDLNHGTFNEISNLLPKETTIFSKELEDLKSCLGCFNCWIKTPGQCIIKDDYTKIPKAVAHTNVFLIITKICYGCYSPYIKNILDRGIPYVLPFFQLVNGDVHHKPRYNKTPKFIVIGYGEDITLSEENTFKELVIANTINLHFKDYEIHVVKNISDIKSLLKNLGGAYNYE